MTTRLFIDEKQQRRLAELLEACPAMVNSRDRALVVGQLRPDIQRQIDPEGKPASVIREMINACVYHTDGIEELIRAIASLEGDSSIPMSEVWRNLPAVLGFFDEDPHETISEVLKHLSEADIDREAMETAFKESVPVQLRDEHGLPGVEQLCRWWMLREMANLDQRQILGCFIRHLLAGLKKRPGKIFGFFKDRSSRASGRNVKHSLSDWAAQIAEESPASHESSKIPLAKDSSGSSRGRHLVVQLAPSPVNKKTFRVSFHPLYENERSLSDPGKELDDLHVEDIERELDEFLRRKDEDSLPQAVEIMVPGDYLTTLERPPHLWRLKAGRAKGRERLLGKTYAVYMRLNRHERPSEEKNESGALPADQRRSWRSKWRVFADSTNPADCIHWECDPTACSWEALDAKLCHAKGRPCLVLAFEPEVTPDDAWLDDVLLESGVPVAIWGDAGEEEIKTLLAPLIDGGSLRNLPDRLWEHRDLSKETDLSYRLTLLWDNPERDIHRREQDPKNPPHYPMDVLS